MDRERRGEPACRRSAKPDVVFNALHGVPGEDGTVQGMLDLMGLILHAQRAGHLGDRHRQGADQAWCSCRTVCRCRAGGSSRAKSLFGADPLPRPYVVKPVNEGSSVGVAIVTAREQLRQPHRPRCEGSLAGFRRDCSPSPSCGARAHRRGARATRRFAVTELKPKTGFYDYDAKYTDGLTEHVCPAAGARRTSRRR